MILMSTLTLAEATDLSHEAFDKLRNDNPESILLDVRTPDEYKDGFIKGAVNIPHTNLDKILSTVDKEDWHLT